MNTKNIIAGQVATSRTFHLGGKMRGLVARAGFSIAIAVAHIEANYEDSAAIHFKLAVGDSHFGSRLGLLGGTLKVQSDRPWVTVSGMPNSP